MSRLSLHWFLVIVIAICCSFSLPSLADVEKGNKKNSGTEGGVHIEYDPSEVDNVSSEMRYTPPIQSLADNPIVAMGLASGTDAINRSVDSLMDSLFYSLLDNERLIPLNDDAWFQLGLQRDVFSTAAGTYVVFDRFQVGPNYVKELARFHNVPIKLGIDANSEVLQIYLRSDGQRVHERETLPFWRRAINQWFGFLPFLSAILPPSFNQNEMYDPLKQLYTPFSFPFSTDGFYEMPVGSIRSYAISGGARLFADVGERLPVDAISVLNRAGGFQANLPYSIFVRGEHRINVLRRSENIAWVGIKNLRRVGHAITSLVGQRFNLLKGALSAKIFGWTWIWQGRPVMMLPLDLSVEQAKGMMFDQVYQYDLTKLPAQVAYKAAVRGDFVPSRLKYLEAKERGFDTGVDFHFARTQGRRELLFGNGPNVALYRNQRSSTLTESDIEITDKEGKFYILEASHDVSDRAWDVLVGEKEKRVQQAVELRVRKVVERSDNQDGKGSQEKQFYIFDTGPDPYRLSVILSIQDRNVLGNDLADYIKSIRIVSGLPMESLPEVKVRDPEAESFYRRSRVFVGPDKVPLTLHVTPAFLGRFGAQLLMSFSGKDLETILERSENEMWAAFAEAYGLDKETWSDESKRSTWTQKLWWLASYLMSPARLVNMRFAKIDAMQEARRFVKSLIALKEDKLPEDMLSGFGRLLDTSYPEHLLKALLSLSDSSSVSRRVIFSTEAKGRGSEKEKEAFARMNNLSFNGGLPIPPPSRYARAKEKLAGFYLDKPQGSQNRPQILRIDVLSQEVPTSLQFLQGEKSGFDWSPRDAGLQPRHVLMSVLVRGGPVGRPIKMFVKIEQAGRLKLGKLELAERVIEVPPLAGSSEIPDTASYDIYLTGPLSPLSGYFFERSVDQGDQFQATISVSLDGVSWGDSRSFDFYWENGKLSPVL